MRPSGMSPPPGKLAATLALMLGAVLGLGGVAGPAGPAGPGGLVGRAEAAEVLRVTAGFGGVGLPGATIPVRVRISADRLVGGSAEVAVGQEGGPVAARVSAPVEVPGGSVKEYLLVVPTPTVAPLRLDVRLIDRRGTVVAREPVAVQPPRDEELVGLLPGVLAGAAPPGPAPLAVDAGVARFFVLDEALMARAPQSIESLGAVGIPAEGLRTLAPGVRMALLRWVAAGGRLLVDASAGATVEGLPDEWDPRDGSRSAAGRGEVVLTGGSMAAGRWSGLIEPTPRGGPGAQLFSPGSLVSSSLAEDAGLAARGQGWLTGILLLYVVVVGPLLFLLLRRRRREELAWVAVPVAAVLFATGSYVQGRHLRAAGDAHASVIVAAPEAAGGPGATSYVGVVAGRTGVSRIRFPAGWSVRISGTGSAQTGGPVAVATTRAGQEAGLPLNSGQAGIVAGSGPLAVPGPGLTVTAVVRDGRLAGVVRNGTPFRLESAAVVVGSAATVVGTLAPGEERAWGLTGDAPLPVGDPLAAAVMMTGGSEAFEGALGAYGLWQSVQAIAGSDLPAPGEATAVGWTRDFRPAFVVNGRTERPPGRTMVLATSRVSYESGRLPLLGVLREQLRGQGSGFPGQADMATVGASVVRFRPPPGAGPRSLVLRTLTGAQVDVWRDGAWRSLAAGSGTLVNDATLESSGGPFMPTQPFAGPLPPKVVVQAPGIVQGGLQPASTLVEHDLGVSGGGPLYVRVQTPDGQATGGGYSWLREAGT